VLKKISVVMTTYNGEKYLIKQLDSLKNQTKTLDEVIIVDDKSSDKTSEIITEYIEKNSLLSWKLYENEENLGFKKNFLSALKLSTGDIVFLCDQDDIWESEKVEKTSALFEKNNVFGVMTGFSYIDGEDNPINDANTSNGIYAFLDKKPKSVFSKLTLKKIMHKNISPGCTCAFCRKAVDIYIENANCELAHDYQLCSVCAALDGLYFYNLPLTKYRIHENNTLGLNKLNQSRIDIAKEKSDLSKVFSNININLKNVNEMYQKRLVALKNKKGFFGLLFDKKYLSLFELKEILGDMLYILR